MVALEVLGVVWLLVALWACYPLLNAALTQLLVGVVVSTMTHEPQSLVPPYANLELIVILNDGALRRLALDAAGLSPDSLAAVSALVQQLRRVEGSPSLLAQTITSADDPARSRRRRAHGGRGRRSNDAPPPA